MYTFDQAARLQSVQDTVTGSYNFVYDNMNRLTSTTVDYSFDSTGALTVQYGYDKASNRTSLIDPQNLVPTAYGYDTLNRLANITLNNAPTPTFVFGYDALSRRNSLTRPNGIDTTYGYDTVSRLLSVLHKLGTTTLDGATYTYDGVGNRHTRTDKRTNVTLTYGYDNIYQLQTAKQGTTTKESYTYDLVGNRLSSLGVSPYVYNSSNELTSTPSGSYGYDNNGNRKSDPSGTQYFWDFENRLTQVVLPGTGGTVNFLYDPFGRRVQKAFMQSGTITTTNYVYEADGDNVIEEVDSGGNVLARYTEGLKDDELLSQLRSGTTSYFEQDALSSVTSLSNASGSLANTYTFDSFGNVTASTGTLTNPFQYTGRDNDSETGLYYYRARYFDPRVGRFISEDPLGVRDHLNMYTYVRNNPVNFDDPLGLYQTRGFDADQKALLDAAIAEALAKLNEKCPNCAGTDGPKIANAIQGLTFVYRSNLRKCGETGPLTFARIRHEVALGPSSFHLGECCSLASTVVHEAIHSLSHFEKKASGIEEQCFGKCGQQ